MAVELSKKIEIARWLIDPDHPSHEATDGEARQQISPNDLALLEKRLKEAGLFKVYEEIELPLVEILEEMHKIGIKVNLEYLAELSSELEKEISALVKKIYKLSGKEFNINSPKQLSEILFKDLKIETSGILTRKTGAFATDYETLLKLKDRHPIVEFILNYREVFKIKSTYVDPLRELADKPTFAEASAGKNGRVHTTFVQTGTGTGRLSSNNPNLQNIPILSEWGKKVRKAFVAETGFSLAAFDYSQIELRVLATVSGDPKMTKAFNNDLDIHKITASNIYNVPLEKVTSEMRSAAKTLNFGVIYGMGPDAFARATGFNRAEAQKFIQEYFSDFIYVKRWQEKTIQKAKEVGYVENLNGRRRLLPNINWPNRRFAAEAERIATNMPIQGLAADIIKLAMTCVDRMIKKNKWQNKVRMLLTIHDELIFEIKEDTLKDSMMLIQSEMENAYKLAVPLKVDKASGKNWSEL